MTCYLHFGCLSRGANFKAQLFLESVGTTHDTVGPMARDFNPLRTMKNTDSVWEKELVRIEPGLSGTQEGGVLGK